MGLCELCKFGIVSLLQSQKVPNVSFLVVFNHLRANFASNFFGISVGLGHAFLAGLDAFFRIPGGKGVGIGGVFVVRDYVGGLCNSI